MNAVGMQPTRTVRGTIIKVPDNTPGIVFANGEQKFFSLGGIWKSPVAPAVNMVVDVGFDGSGAVASLIAVDQHQINKERLDQFSGAAQQHGKEAAALAKQGIGALAARMGSVELGASVVIWIAWFFLPAITLNLGFLGSKSFTFWDLVGLDLSNPLGIGSSSHGAYAMLGLVAIAAPFAVPFLKQAWAKYLNAAPLAFLIIAVIKVRSEIGSAFGGRGVSARDIKDVMDVFSFSYGLYLLGIAAVVLAVLALKGRSKTA